VSDTTDPAEPFFAFVSDEGHTVGIGKRVEGQMIGACLAYLSQPVTLPVWLDALREEPDPEAAARRLIEHLGGRRLLVITRLDVSTVLPPLAGGPVGEA
jgi:hypothetical protein